MNLTEQIALSLTSTLQVFLAAWLFAHTLPQRSHIRARWTASYLVLAALSCTFIAIGIAFQPEGMGTPALTPHAAYMLGTLIVSTFILIYMVFVIRVCYEVSLWASLATAVAAYTMQNLASGAEGLFELLASAGIAGQPVGLQLRILASILATALVYLPCWHLFIRKLDGNPLDSENRGLVLLMLLVVTSVIGFDILNKNQSALVISLASQIAYRLLHGIFCMTLLYVEYEMLYQKRLELERTAERRIARIREQQLEMGQAELEAVNARVHSIRHDVARQLASADTQSLRLLHDVMKSIEVFDAVFHTGNDALDTVLTQQALLASQKGVHIGCIAEGSALSSLADADVYAPMSSLLGPAVDAASQTGTAHPSISFTIRKRQMLAVVHLESMAPLTTESPSASAQAIVSRYGGTLAEAAEDGQHELTILLPFKEQEASFCRGLASK